MERNPKDRGYGYKKSYEYEESIKESRQKLEDEFIDTFTPSNLIEKISLTFGDRHEHIDFDDFMPMKKHMKKCQDIIIESIKKKKDE